MPRQSPPAATDPNSGSALPTGAIEASATAPAALPRRRLVFGIVAMALFMASVDQTVVATALVAIQSDLGAGIEWSGWTITVYSLGQVIVLPLAGKFADMFGRKRVFLTAAVIFTVASLCCGLVDNIALLVVLRAIQSVGGGAFLPSASGIVADHFGPNRDRALGMFTSIFPIGGIVGPIIGGVFVSYWSWRGIFLVNVPLGVALIIMTVIFIPRDRAAGGSAQRNRIDVYGLALLAGLILGLMLGVTHLGGGGSVLSIGFLLPEVLAVIALVLFVRHAKHGRSPFIPIRLLTGKGFGVMNLINLLHGCAAIGFGALVPLYAETRYGISTLEAGTLLTARAIGMILVASLATFALRRTGSRLPMLIGFSVLAVGMVTTALGAPPGISPYLWLSIASAVSGVGMGIALPASNNAILQLAPDAVAGISGMRAMFRQGGSILSISVATAVLAASTSPGNTLGHVFLVFSGLLILVLPLLIRVPEHRGSW
ncbi:MFS transporter [Microlunatus soli]|uniref:Drug resistance transporter, EmrB/QacA subfamily n=1 Tax=Microlunatus soli TaxID=630515 RepID=A0A1H1QTJ9_9ACTN|nr:MFS transporter [Microlunatus soli]SDS26784.1 drug resistance transporter, EmrB/QacA subfamily [Microlunatus soli]